MAAVMIADSKTTPKTYIGIALAIVFLIIGAVVPGSEMLPKNGVLMLSIFAMAAALWICESLPVGITGLLALVLVLVIGIAPATEVFSGFSSPTMFYLLGAFSLSAILSQTSYGMRLVVFFLRKTNGNGKLIVLAFMVAAALLSSVMSDTAAVLMFIAFAKGICDALGCKPKESNFGRCLYIGLLYASIVGGFATLAGGPNNMAVVQISGISIGFLDWMIVGIPVSIVMVPVCWYFIVRAFPPEEFSKEQFRAIVADIGDKGATSFQEKKALAFVIALPVLWIAGNWITALNVTTVALLGLVVAFLPGVKLLTWKQYQESVPWVVLVMVGCIFSMSTLMKNTGVIDFIGSLINATGMFSLPFYVAILLYLFFAYAIFTMCPVGGVWEALFVPVLVGFCVQCGVSPTIAPFAILFAFGGNFLLPINPLNMYSYAYGYFTPGELFRAGIIPALILLVLDALWVPTIVGILGI